MRIAIVGNGAAGNQAAATIKQHDASAEIRIFSREPYPFYSPCALPDCLAGNLDRNQLFLNNLASYQNTGIETSFSEVVEFIDPKMQKVITDKSSYDYDRLIIATGSRALIPPVKGAMLPGTFTLKTLDDMDRLTKHQASRVMVVGSGNIGLEAAQAMSDRGCEVSIIESMNQIMPRLFDQKPASLIRKLLERTGLQVFTGETVLEVQGGERVEGIVTDQRTLPCDTLIWAVGLKPESHLAASAGLELGELGGIKVNRQMQCSAANVYACGDCAESYDLISGRPVLSMLWPSARRQAQVAALNCLNHRIEYEGAFNMVVEEIDGQPIGAAGLKEDSFANEVRVMEEENDNAYWRILFHNQRVIGMQAIGNLEGMGVMAGWMKRGGTLQESAGIISNPALKMTMPWMIEAMSRFLPDYMMGGIAVGKPGSIY